MKNTLYKLGILKTENLASDKAFCKIVKAICTDGNFASITYARPHEYVEKLWSEYKVVYSSNSSKKNSLNGSIFEAIIYTLFYREGILPFYTQASVAFVPNVHFDAILYCKEAPISISCKTSLRERYKQADLEAIALKYVHRRALCYLLTMSRDEAKVVNDKISTGEVIGIEKAIVCDTEDFDSLIAFLKEKPFEESSTIKVVEGNLIKKQ